MDSLALDQRTLSESLSAKHIFGSERKTKTPQGKLVPKVQIYFRVVNNQSTIALVGGCIIYY